MTIEELIKECRARMNKFYPTKDENSDDNKEYEFYHQLIIKLHSINFCQRRAIEIAEELIDLKEQLK